VGDGDPRSGRPPPVLPLYLEQPGPRLSFVGLVTASAGIGGALGGLPSSSLAERPGTDQLLAVNGPVLVGWVADIHGLGAAAIALAVTLTAGVVWIALVIGETGKRNA
jgi:hypothetical protein